MRSDCASSPTRGSRFVGLLSMIITSVFGSGLPEQESAAARKATEASARNILNKPVIPSEGAGPLARRDKSRDLLLARSLSLSIRDLSQDRRAPGSGGGRHIRWSPIPRLERHQRERRCFLGFGGQSEFIRSTDLQPQGSKFICQHG